MYTYKYGCINGSYNMVLNIYKNGQLIHHVTNTNKIQSIMNHMKHSEEGKQQGIEASVKKYFN